tara:strand:+ start:1524 stop:1769 length:246 start_codon:yes stop_codon:yes gene_type:complete
MPEDTIQNYVNRIAELEDQVDKQKEAFRKAIDLNALLANPREYIKNLSMDFYESNEDILREAVDLGEDKAKKILKDYVKTD